MLKKILSISGKQGLFRLISQGKNMLIVESLLTGKRVPVYSHDKVISLGDISIYTTEDDVPLVDVLESVRVKNENKPVDLKKMGNDGAIREYFKEYLPNFDEERVYTTDIKKIFNWYNGLISSGFTSFKDDDKKEDEENYVG